MKVVIQRDQAVWERETFTIEVPDGLTGEDLREAIRETIKDGDAELFDDYTKWTLDEPVYGINTVTVGVINEMERVL